MQCFESNVVPEKEKVFRRSGAQRRSSSERESRIVSYREATTYAAASRA
jgi:hypothetical protein